LNLFKFTGSNGMHINGYQFPQEVAFAIPLIHDTVLFIFRSYDLET